MGAARSRRGLVGHLAAVGESEERIAREGRRDVSGRTMGAAFRCQLWGRCFGIAGCCAVSGGRFRSCRCGGGWRNRPCGRVADTKCRPRTWRRRLCYPARRRSSKWQRRENVAQREMRDKGGSAAPAGTPPGRLRPARDSSPGSPRLLLPFSSRYIIFVTLIWSARAGFPRLGSPAERPRGRPCSAALAARAVPLSVNAKASGPENSRKVKITLFLNSSSVSSWILNS